MKTLKEHQYKCQYERCPAWATSKYLLLCDKHIRVVFGHDFSKSFKKARKQ